MNYLTNKILYIILSASILMSPVFIFASDKIQIESATLFNTACSRCHEGECSGRMSFHLPKSAANQHIRRHGGDLSLETIRQLFELLRYMKEECSFYPLPLALPQDRIWGSDTLAKLQSPSKQAYFIPLGLLEPDLYQLLFAGLNDNSKFCVEIINQEFDFVDKQDMKVAGEQKSLLFQVDERSEHFLRITAQEPINLIQLKLEVHDKEDSLQEYSQLLLLHFL